MAQVARRYALNANQIFKWLKDPRYAPGDTTSERPTFLPVEINASSTTFAAPLIDELPQTDCGDRPARLEIILPDGIRLKVDGGFDGGELARLTNLYDLMDSAYDAPEIKEKCRALGHVAIIDANPRRGGKAEAELEAKARRQAGYRLAEDVRYNERSAAERVNSALKDSYGGRFVRVRGHAKVFCHLMFGILALSVDQLMRLLT